MVLHNWKVTNAEGKIIDNIITSTNDVFFASGKLNFRYGKNASFLKIEYDKKIET